MQSTNKVKINVCGSDYVIASTENEEYVKELAYQIDTQVTGMMQDNSNMSVLTAMLICAMSYLDDYNKANANSDNMRRQLKDYLEDAAKARIEADEVKRELERLNRELIAAKKALRGQGQA